MVTKLEDELRSSSAALNKAREDAKSHLARNKQLQVWRGRDWCTCVEVSGLFNWSFLLEFAGQSREGQAPGPQHGVHPGQRAGETAVNTETETGKNRLARMLRCETGPVCNNILNMY